MTPEGIVKKGIDKLLNEFGEDLWWHKPVQNGMGTACLDYHCCYHGHYFAVEAKAPDHKLTARQENTAEAIERAGGMVFVVKDTKSLEALRTWLMEIEP